MDIATYVGLGIAIYLIPIIVSVKLIEEYGIYIINGTILFIPFVNIIEMFDILGEVVKLISNKAYKERKEREK